jgi:hypothetical protein
MSDHSGCSFGFCSVLVSLLRLDACMERIYKDCRRLHFRTSITSYIRLYTACWDSYSGWCWEWNTKIQRCSPTCCIWRPDAGRSPWHAYTSYLKNPRRWCFVAHAEVDFIQSLDKNGKAESASCKILTKEKEEMLTLPKRMIQVLRHFEAVLIGTQQGSPDRGYARFCCLMTINRQKKLDKV